MDCLVTTLMKSKRWFWSLVSVFWGKEWFDLMRMGRKPFTLSTLQGASFLVLSSTWRGIFGSVVVIMPNGFLYVQVWIILDKRFFENGLGFFLQIPNYLYFSSINLNTCTLVFLAWEQMTWWVNVLNELVATFSIKYLLSQFIIVCNVSSASLSLCLSLSLLTLFYQWSSFSYGFGEGKCYYWLACFDWTNWCKKG